MEEDVDCPLPKPAGFQLGCKVEVELVGLLRGQVAVSEGLERFTKEPRESED